MSELENILRAPKQMDLRTKDLIQKHVAIAAIGVILPTDHLREHKLTRHPNMCGGGSAQPCMVRLQAPGCDERIAALLDSLSQQELDLA
jgi:hypothetical protein